MILISTERHNHHSGCCFRVCNRAYLNNYLFYEVNLFLSVAKYGHTTGKIKYILERKLRTYQTFHFDTPLFSETLWNFVFLRLLVVSISNPLRLIQPSGDVRTTIL